MCARKNKEGNDHHWTDKAADKIAHACLGLQTNISKWMNKQISMLSNKSIKIGLILFSLVSGGFSIYLALNAILGDVKKQTVFEVKRINTLKHFDKTGTEIGERINYVSEQLYQELQLYKQYMDSTGQSIRKGLSDSIEVLEQIYHSQKIK